jgi:uncharacterized membrane protein
VQQITLDIIELLFGVLLTATVLSSAEYYRQVRKAQKEYQKAKGIVEEIVFSFDRELKRESERLAAVAFTVENNLAKVDTSLDRIDRIEKKVEPTEVQLKGIAQIKTDITANVTNILAGITSLESKIKDIDTAQETLKTKVSGLEEQIQKLTIIPEVKNEPPAPAIVLRRDKAMSALTDTEIQVLEMLASQGSKTAPEIKEKVNLSREHTARLMKKLYEEGYVEREVGKIPFRYSIKEEMEKLLKKTDAPQA